VVCKSKEEIDAFIEGLEIARKIDVPMLDIDYMDEHKHDQFPFYIGQLNDERHILNPQKLLYISNTLQEVEIEIDHNIIISDWSIEEKKFHWVGKE